MTAKELAAALLPYAKTDAHIEDLIALDSLGGEDFIFGYSLPFLAQSAPLDVRLAYEELRDKVRSDPT